MLVWYILSSVCLRWSQLSQSSFMQHIGMCVFSLSISLKMIVRIRVLYLIIIIGIRVRSWNYGMSCISVCILIIKFELHPKLYLFLRYRWYRAVNSDLAYSISQEICTRFCCALLCCGYAIVHNEFTWSIYPYSSGLLCWHWGNR